MLTRMKKLRRPFHYVVTATTRRRREREEDGVDYHFVSEREFQSMIDNGELLEWATVYGNYYGVPRAEIDRSLGKGADVIVKVDVQGATTIKKTLPQALFIFLTPPSMEYLERRLRQRHSESDADLAVRLGKAEEEIGSVALFDYVITSNEGRIAEVISQIETIVAAEKSRVNPRVVRL